MARTIEDRFWSKVDKSGTCWLWTAGTDDAGYGQFRLDGKNIKAHRVSFFLAFGYWPVVTRHSCDNPPCVNPDHLLDGTYASNNLDISVRNRRSNNVGNDIAKQIRQEEYDDTVISRVVEKYGVSEYTARGILTGKTYKHIEPPGRKIPPQRYRRKLTNQEVNEIRSALQNTYWGQQNELAEKYHVSRDVISRIKYDRY